MAVLRICGGLITIIIMLMLNVHITLFIVKEFLQKLLINFSVFKLNF